MIDSMAKAIVVLGAVLGGWLLVQAAWRRTLADETSSHGSTSSCGWDCHGCRGGGHRATGELHGAADNVVADNCTFATEKERDHAAGRL